jgi:hypothetical protein
MAGLGLLFAGLSGAGKALASSAQEEQRVNDQIRLDEARAKLEEERALRIDEAKRQRERQGAMQMGQDITAQTAMLQNQRDAESINAKYGSQMTAADAQVLRDNPEARKAYGLLGSTRQGDLEDRATAAERLGYLDAARETRGQLQTEVTNQRNQRNDENADKRLEAEQKWRERTAQMAEKREDRMARLAEADLALRRAQAAKADSRETMAAKNAARQATVEAMKGYETEIKQLAKDAADPLLAPEQKQVIQQQIEEARRQAAALRRSLAGAGIEGGAAPDKPFNPADFPLAGAKSGTSGGERVANPFSGGASKEAGSRDVARLTPDAQRRLDEAERRELSERAKQQAEEFSRKSAGGNRLQQPKSQGAGDIAALEKRYQEALTRLERGKNIDGPPGLKLRAEADVRAAKAALDEAKAAAR